MAEQDFEQLLATIEKINAQLNTLTGKLNQARQSLSQIEDPGARGAQGRSIGGLQTAINRLEQKINELSSRALREASEERQRAVTRPPYGRVPGDKVVIGPAPVREGLEAANVQGKIDNEVRRFARAVAENFQNGLIRGAVESRTPRQLPLGEYQKVFLDMINDIQKQILQAAVNAAQKPVSGNLQNAADKFLAIERLQNARRAGPGGFRSKIFPELYPSQPYEPSPVTYIPKPLAPKSPESAAIEQSERQVSAKIVEGWQRMAATIERIARGAAAREGLARQGGGGRRELFETNRVFNFESGRLEDVVSQKKTFGAFAERIIESQRQEAFKRGRLPTFEASLEARRQAGGDLIPAISSATDRARELQERLNRSMIARVSSEEKYRQALEQAARQGFNVNDLKKVQTRGTAGIEQLQFQRFDESGINRRFDTYVQPSGRATPGISNQFRSFGQGVVRDIGELTKWSLALAAVYGPLRKLQELTQIMIENQTRLAEATISVGSAFLDQGEIFSIAAEQAEIAGESITGVIDAFTQAYRATGGAGTEVDRLRVSQELLNDSLLLSKLSTLDQAQAIDTLSAALRQSGDALGGNNNVLERGTQLLDKWVRVTKIANVDLASLATGFAVLGDAADAAQINVDQLNGLLGAIAETGVASGRELANTARAIVAGVQSDQAREALENIGVAFENSTGEARPFLEIMTELSNLRLSGALDDTAFSKLTLALGGGTRRQAAYATLIENIGRVNEIAAESARANGDAQAALAKQLETVQTSLTRLGNAFQELAQTLGVEGGFLGIITASVDGLTSLVQIFDDLTRLLGKATPALLAFIAAAGILKYRGQGGIQSALGGLGQSITRDPVLERLAAYGAPAGFPSTAPAASRFGRFAQSNIFGTNAPSGGFQGLAVALLPAMQNFFNKDDRQGKGKAGLDLLGGVAGGILGSLTPAGPIIGAMIGTAAAEAFAASVIDRKTDIFGYQAPTLEEPGKTPGGESEISRLDKELQQAEIDLYKSIGFGNETLGKLISDPGNRATGIVEQLNKAISDRDEEEFNRLLSINGDYGQFTTTNRRELQEFGVNEDFLQQAFAQNRQIQFDPQTYVREIAKEREDVADALRNLEAAQERRAAYGGTPIDEEQQFAREREANQERFQSLLDTLTEASKQQLREQRISGDVRGAEYGRRSERIQGLDTRALQYYTALGDEVDTLTGGAENAAGAFEVLRNVIVGGAEESLPQLTAISTEIQTLTNLLEHPALNEEALEAFGGTEEAKVKLEELRQALAALIVDANKDVLLGQIKIPEVEGDITKPLTTQELGTVEQRARQLQDDFYQGFLQIPDDMYDALKDSWEEWAQIVEESGEVFFRTVSEIDPQFFQQAMQQLLEENKLASQEQNPFGIQQIDLPSSRAGELQAMIDYFGRYLAQNFPQYEQNPEQFGVIFNDYVTSILHGDNLAVKLALEKLVDINQKQLDGMYNIPEGATFWVPLTAAYYRPKNEGQGGLPGVGEIQGVDENTNATDRNTSALDQLRESIVNRKEEAVNKEYSQYGKGLDRGQRADAARLQAMADRYNQERARAADAARYEGLASLYGAGAGTGQEAASAADRGLYGINPVTALMNQLQTWLQNLVSTIGQEFPTRQGPRPDGLGDVGGRYSSLPPSTATQPISARLEIQMDNTTQLVVDGRILASVLSPYLAQEMIRIEAAQGTITRRFVI